MNWSNIINGNFSKLMEKLNKYFERSQHMPRKTNEKTTTSRPILAKFFFFLRYKHKRNIHSSKEEHKLSLKENKPGFLECLIWNTEWRKMMKQCLYRYNKILQSEIFIYNWKYKRTENIPPSRVFKNLLELYSKQLIYKAKF